MSQQNVSAFFQLAAGDPHLAERLQDIPAAADAPSRLIELAASVGLPFSLQDLRAVRTEVHAGRMTMSGALMRRWLEASAH